MAGESQIWNAYLQYAEETGRGSDSVVSSHSHGWDIWVDTVLADPLNRSRPRAVRALSEWAAASVQRNNDVHAGISAGFAAVSRAAESPETTIEAAHLAIGHAVMSLQAAAKADMDEWHAALREAAEMIGLRLPAQRAAAA